MKKKTTLSKDLKPKSEFAARGEDEAEVTVAVVILEVKAR